MHKGTVEKLREQLRRANEEVARLQTENQELRDRLNDLDASLKRASDVFERARMRDEKQYYPSAIR